MDAKFQELCNIIQSLQQEIIELKKNQQISENFAINRPELKIPLPEKFGNPEPNSYFLGYWRVEWCEFFVSAIKIIFAQIGISTE